MFSSKLQHSKGLERVQTARSAGTGLQLGCEVSARSPLKRVYAVPPLGLQRAQRHKERPARAPGVPRSPPQTTASVPRFPPTRVQQRWSQRPTAPPRYFSSAPHGLHSLPVHTPVALGATSPSRPPNPTSGPTAQELPPARCEIQTDANALLLGPSQRCLVALHDEQAARLRVLRSLSLSVGGRLRLAPAFGAFLPAAEDGPAWGCIGWAWVKAGEDDGPAVGGGCIGGGGGVGGGGGGKDFDDLCASRSWGWRLGPGSWQASRR